MVEAAFENRYNKLWVQSAYLSNKKEVVTQAPDATVRSPMVTPEAPPASPTSKVILSQDGEKVNNEGYAKGVISRSEVAPFKYGNNDIKAMPYIDEKDGIRTIGATKSMDEDAFVEGLWDGAPNTNKNIVEKSQLENVENLSDDYIIKMAREYLHSAEGQKDTRPYLRNRPSYGKNQEQIVYDNGKNIFGNVYDPSGAKVPWDPSKPRKGQWDMGHIPGQKYSVVHSKYVIEMMTPKEFVQWYRDPKNYRPELPSTNRSHKYE